MKIFSSSGGAQQRPLELAVWLALALVVILQSSGLAQAQEPVDRTWGFGWDHGLTARVWMGGVWEVSVAAGPDDYLSKVESRSWMLTDPSPQQGLLEVPEDVREEHGWVRFQVGRLIKHHNDFTVTGYGGVVYEWIVHQDRTLMLHDLNSDYDTFELDRHTRRWVMTLGFRPAWQATSFLTIEAAFGLNFIVENWDQTTHQTYSGSDGFDYEELDGHAEIFEDFGIEGLASIQVFFWL